jgi:heparanase
MMKGVLIMSLERLRTRLLQTLLTAAVMGLLSCTASGQTALSPQTMPQIGQVDSRFLSFNVETVEVTGGRFWKPYKQDSRTGSPADSKARPDQNQPAGMDAGLFAFRPPINLYNPKLRKLASALSPAFVRVSGTWRNSTYFQDNDEPAMKTPPDGYKGVLTRAEWKGVVDFSRAIGADLVTSVATSAGTRNPAGVWTPDQAKAFFEYTKSLGGHIAATEFMNEPTFAVIGGAPQNYDAAAFAEDVKVFNDFLRKESPGTISLGPGSVGEGVSMIEGAPIPKMIHSEDMLKATGPVFDAFSYHFYGTVSRRCTGPLGPNAGMTPERALSAAWLERNITVEAFYAKLRDQYLPGKALWLTETGEAGCGGDPWAAEFLDSFRFMDQLGSLAQKGVKTVMVNTLASSDYGLLDEETLDPRPNFWAALLWKRMMGTRVLDPGPFQSPSTRVYAQCAKDSNGGVALLLLNLDRTAEQVLQPPLAGERYTLSAPDLLSKTVSLNGVELKIGTDGALPQITGSRFKAGALSLAPLTITFIVLPDAKNAGCMRQ